MRPCNVKLICAIGLLSLILIFLGCGTEDFLDQESTRISASVVPKDGDDATHEIDMFFNICDDANASTTDDVESNFPFGADIIVETDSTAPEFRIERYVVYFSPNHGTYDEVTANEPPLNPPANSFATTRREDFTGAEMPTLTGSDLNPSEYPISELIMPSSTVTIPDLLVWPQGDKEFFVDDFLRFDPLFAERVATFPGGGVRFEWATIDYVYDMQVVLHCRDISGTEFTISTPWTPVHFLDVNRCT